MLKLEHNFMTDWLPHPFHPYLPTSLQPPSESLNLIGLPHITWNDMKALLLVLFFGLYRYYFVRTRLGLVIHFKLVVDPSWWWERLLPR